ncbi:RNA-binding protein 34-like [Sabethes cyaneus]|uniref:RNA-binding protein 34-like n=1 Tax=Sabethes cyaneus TaxID=53552 RepID=UPI00237E638E|nr:RNA-binding protein 34-like [Sabethes cyaneus]
MGKQNKTGAPENLLQKVKKNAYKSNVIPTKQYKSKADLMFAVTDGKNHNNHSLNKSDELQRKQFRILPKMKNFRKTKALVINTEMQNKAGTELKADKEVMSPKNVDGCTKVSLPKSNNAVENRQEKRVEGTEHSVFVGNLPKTAKKSTLKQMFKSFGKILTIRFRTLDGEVLLKKKDRETAKALNCYIRFQTKDEALAACAMNGHIFDGHHLRVSLQSQKQIGHHASTVFVGNIHRDTTDNELYDFFSTVGDIEYVRQISGKYIGYVCFKKGVSIAKALKLNQQLLNGRPLRIMKVDHQKQSTRKNKKGNLVKKNASVDSDIKSIESIKNVNIVHSDRTLTKRNTLSNFHGNLTKANGSSKQKLRTKAERKKKLLALKLSGNRVNGK